MSLALGLIFPWVGLVWATVAVGAMVPLQNADSPFFYGDLSYMVVGGWWSRLAGMKEH